MYDFNGRSIIVTGGATGIGCGITQMLLEYGANVLAVGRRDYEIVDEQLKKHSAFGYLQADINHPPDRQRIIQTAETQNFTEFTYTKSHPAMGVWSTSGRFRF